MPTPAAGGARARLGPGALAIHARPRELNAGSIRQKKMFEVSVSGYFAASHQLRRADGTLEPLHGHDWRVEATFAGTQLNQAGVLLDFGRVKARLDELLTTLRDRNLNDLAPFAAISPSAENLAVHLAGQLGQNLPDGVCLRCIEVEEAPGCVARYRPDGGDNAAK